MSEFVSPSPDDAQAFERVFGGRAFHAIPKFVGYTLLSGADIGVPVIDCIETRSYITRANKRVAHNPHYAQEVNRLARRLGQQTNRALRVLDKDEALRNTMQRRAMTEAWLEFNEHSADLRQVTAAETVLDNLLVESGMFPYLVRELQDLEGQINDLRFSTPAYLELQERLFEHCTWHQGLEPSAPLPPCLVNR